MRHFGSASAPGIILPARTGVTTPAAGQHDLYVTSGRAKVRDAAGVDQPLARASDLTALRGGGFRDGDYSPLSSQLKGWSVDTSGRTAARSQLADMVNDRLWLIRLPAIAGSITGAYFLRATGGSPQPYINRGYYGLYDTAGNRLAQTTDWSTRAAVGNALQWNTITNPPSGDGHINAVGFTSSVSLTTASVVVVAILMSCAVSVQGYAPLMDSPRLYYFPGGSSVELNFGLQAPPWRMQYLDGQTSLPATVNYSACTRTPFCFMAGVY